MEALARSYIGLVASDEVVAKALKISEVSRIARAEARLREFVDAAWNKRAKMATKKAVSMAKQLKTSKQISATVDRIMAGWAKDVTPVFTAELENIYKLARIAAYKKAILRTKAPLQYDTPKFEKVKKAAAGTIRAAQLLPSFDLVDDMAVEALKKDQTFWIGRHYQHNLSPTIAKVSREVMIEAGKNAKLAGDLMSVNVANAFSHVSIPGGFHGTSKQYFEGLVANAATVGRVHGQMTSFMQIGITRYRITNPSDHRTCPVCTHMDGKVFTTQQGAQQMGDEMAAKTPEDIKKIHPWHTEKELKKISPASGRVKGPAGVKDSKALADAGFSLPPFHFRCRCTVDVSEEAGSYKDLSPMSPPTPKINRLASASVWAKSLTLEQKQAFQHWGSGGYRLMRELDAGKIAASKLLSSTTMGTKIIPKQLNDIKTALKTSPIHKGTVYRGMRYLTQVEAEGYKRGSIFSFDALSSWSKNEVTATDFARPTMMEGTKIHSVIFKVKTTNKSYNISKVSGLLDEQEVLLTKGKKFQVIENRVKDVIDSEGNEFRSHYVTLKEVAQ